MKFYKAPMLGALACALMAGAMPTNTLAQTTPTVPIEVWALRNVVNTVEVSPDGKHILVLKTESKKGDYVLEIYKADDLSKPLRRLNADPMEIISARWVSDNYIYGTAWQVVRDSVDGPEEDVRGYKTFSYNLDKNKFSQVDGDFSIVNLLPDEPDHVLVSTGRDIGGLGVDPFQAFRPRSYYRFDLSDGSRELVLKGSSQYPTAEFDDQGNPRFTSSVDEGSNRLKYYYRLPGDGSWTEYSETYDLDNHENLYRILGGFQGLVGVSKSDPTIGYVIDNRGEDKAALWKFDFKTGTFAEKLYSNPNADVIGIQTHSIPGNGSLVAAIYPGAKYERAWFDEGEKALYESLAKSIPYSHQISITSRSRDGNTMIVQNSGPHDPGSFWLVKDGKMSKLGSRNPLLKQADLADVEFIQYPARDGRTIPAYVTKPKGQGPFPLVVLPHGGPHVTEVVGYDEWGQLLADAGYMVLQPQYRMSVGWGKDHFDSAYGQHGLAMQDDKDDGALYLAKQGLVDPERMAMFGWSYGGYAALVAASRDPQIYQCVIAGAAVADPAKVYRERRSPYAPKALDEWSQRRGMIGINPINEVAKVNVPVLMVHGDVDSRVLYFNFEDYKQAMAEAGKNATVIVGGVSGGGRRVQGGSGEQDHGEASYSSAQYLTLEGAGHFYRTLMFDHQQTFFTKMLDFLENDCGPGGL